MLSGQAARTLSQTKGRHAVFPQPLLPRPDTRVGPWRPPQTAQALGSNLSPPPSTLASGPLDLVPPRSLPQTPRSQGPLIPALPSTPTPRSPAPRPPPPSSRPRLSGLSTLRSPGASTLVSLPTP